MGFFDSGHKPTDSAIDSAEKFQEAADKIRAKHLQEVKASEMPLAKGSKTKSPTDSDEAGDVHVDDVGNECGGEDVMFALVLIFCFLLFVF